ncbi:hypothetical protein NMG60_11024993, partial [Bertholletia excelsa]
IVKIFISHSDLIDLFQFVYVGEDGDLLLSERHGDECGIKLDIVELNYPDEFLTSISGSYHTSRNALTSILFTTNISTHGPFGKQNWDDREFNFSLGEDRSFGGFHGTTTRLFDATTSRIILESIGVYIKPFIEATVSNNNFAREIKQKDQTCSCWGNRPKEDKSSGCRRDDPRMKITQAIPRIKTIRHAEVDI